MRRTFLFFGALAFLAACAILALLASRPDESARVLYVANWSDYIDPAMVEDFTRETGIRIVYDTYDSNEMLETRLLAGATGYDLVAPTASYLQRQIRAGAFRPLDLTLLPNRALLDPAIMAKLAQFDANNAFSIPYMWSTTGFALNVGKTSALPGAASLRTWRAAFAPTLLAQMRACGVYMLDSPEDLFAGTFVALGIDPATSDPDAFLKAGHALEAIRPFVKKFHSSEYINALANGDICMAVGWAGDSLQARTRAREAENGVDIRFVIPEDGALISIDAFAIPADARHVAEAHAFLNFLMRPDVAARNSAITNFANPVPAARPLMPAAIAQDPSIFPPAEVMAKSFVAPARDQALQKLMTRILTDVKLGRRF